MVLLGIVDKILPSKESAFGLVGGQGLLASVEIVRSNHNLAAVARSALLPPPTSSGITRKPTMRHNRLRALLTAGEPSIGTHLLSSWPTLVELVGDAGNYDYIEFTAEYAPFDMHDLDNLGRALELKNLGGMIKIEQTQWTHQAMRAIGSGFQAVLFADLRRSKTRMPVWRRCVPKLLGPPVVLAWACGGTWAPCVKAARLPMSKR
jgi:hypothetical protein